MYNKISNIFAISLAVITSVFLIVSTISSAGIINIRAVYLYNHRVLTAFYVIIGAIFLGVAVISIYKLVDKMTNKSLKIFMFSLLGFFALIEVFVLYNFVAIPNTDAYRCVDTAIAFANNNIDKIDASSDYASYFNAYSNNNMFIVMLSWLYRYIYVLLPFKSHILFAEIVIAVSMFIGVCFSVATVNKLEGLNKAVKFLILAVLNPTLYIFITWIYTSTFSISIMMAILYFGVSIKNAQSFKKKLIYIIVVAVLSALSYLIRPTAIFPLMAIIVVFALNIKINKKFLKSATALTLTFLLFFTVSFVSLKNAANEKFKDTLENNFPIFHWIEMGSHDYGTFNEEDFLYTKSFKTKQEKTEANIEKIKQNYSNYNLITFTNHIINKVVTNWSDGTHSYYVRATRLQNYTKVYDYVTGSKNTLFSLYCQIFWFFTMLFALIYLIKLIQKNDVYKSPYLPVIITLFGAFIFYTVWEVKADYSLPFTLLLLMLSTSGADLLKQKLTSPDKKQKYKQLKIMFASLMTLSIIVSIMNCATSYKTFTQENVINQIPTIDYINLKFSKKINDVCTKNKDIIQEFYAQKTFNTIKLPASIIKPLNKSKKTLATYKVTLDDENGTRIFSNIVNYKSVKHEILTFKFNNINPIDKTKYKLSISKYSGSIDTINYFTGNSITLDYYNGKLLYGSKHSNNDLLIDVNETKLEPTISLITYILVVGVIVLLQILLLIICLKLGNSEAKND